MTSIVITGSTRGIGFGLAKAFISRSCNVTISGRSQSSIKTAIGQLSGNTHNDLLYGFPCDVRQPEQIQALWEAAYNHFGRIDIWINNAGFTSTSALPWLYPAEQIKNILDTNLLGAIYGSVTAINGMLVQGSGAIYNMEGMGSDGRKHSGLAYYGMTKYGLSYFTDCLVDDTKGTPLIVGALRPGMVITDMIYEQYKERPEEFQDAQRIFNIIADTVDNVSPWLATRILNNKKSGVRISYMSRTKMIGRFLTAPFTKRDLFAHYDAS